MTPQIGEIWQARVMGVHYLLLEESTAVWFGIPQDQPLFKTLRLETGVIELWVVCNDHFRRVA
jgi:hypothetical protein